MNTSVCDQLLQGRRPIDAKQVLPRPTINHVLDEGVLDAMLLRDVVKRDAREIGKANGHYCLGRCLGLAVRLALQTTITGMAALCVAINHVGLVVTYPKVIGVHAGGVVARVTDEFAIWNTALRVFIGETMGEARTFSRAGLEAAITLGVSVRSPLPAAAGGVLVNFGPKPFIQHTVATSRAHKKCQALQADGGYYLQS